MKPSSTDKIMRMLEDLVPKKETYVKYVSSKGCCEKCAENDGKIFKLSDSSKPELPIHPNCKCRYEEVTNAGEIKAATEGYSETVRIDDSPGFGGIRASGIDDMLKKLEQKYPYGGINELIISNHGGLEGFYPMGKNDALNRMTSEQIERLKRLLRSDAVVDIRMCYTSGAEDGNAAAQRLANILGVKVRGYEGPVSPYGTRPFIDKVEKKYFPDNKPKIFYPQKE